ncbi:MAG TPA: hypothetical protein VND98_03815 [Solirubrobacterales bacterium]|nr:hypothetical protein [Solirubrobacterales bacterium]
MTYVLLALLGVAVGTVGTLVGAGGGFTLTPVLLILYPQLSAAVPGAGVVARRNPLDLGVVLSEKLLKA